MDEADFIAYTHPRFQPGVVVCIQETMRERWPTHPLAGKVSTACQGEYSSLLESLREPHQSTIVPVVALEPTVTGACYSLIPQQYVRLAQPCTAPASGQEEEEAAHGSDFD